MEEDKIFDFNYIIVSCIFDTQKRSGLSYKRTGEKYCHLFNYVNNLNLPTILFIESHLIDKIKPREGLIIIKKELEELNTFKKIDPIKETLRPTQNEARLDAYYTSVINSKIELLYEASNYIKEKGLNFSHLLWLDSGISHVGTVPREQFLNDIKLHIYKDKITLVMMMATTPNEIKNEEAYLSVNRGKIAAGLLIVPTDLIDWFNNLMIEQFNKCINIYKRMCMEEQLMSILTVNYPEKFEYIFSDYWMLPNLRYINNRIHIIIANLAYCREHSLLDTGYKILLRLINSLNYARSLCSHHELCQILYDGQIICFYKNRELSKKLGMFLAYLYYTNVHCKAWIDCKYDHIKNNLKFSDVDIDKKEDFTDDKILPLDEEGLLWNSQ